MKNCILCFALRASCVAAMVFGCGAALAGHTVNDYVKGGLMLHFDAEFNSTNAEGVACHDAAATEWLDLSGNGQTATRTTVHRDGLWRRKRLCLQECGNGGFRLLETAEGPDADRALNAEGD